MQLPPAPSKNDFHQSGLCQSALCGSKSRHHAGGSLLVAGWCCTEAACPVEAKNDLSIPQGSGRTKRSATSSGRRGDRL